MVFNFIRFSHHTSLFLIFLIYLTIYNFDYYKIQFNQLLKITFDINLCVLKLKQV